MLVVTAIQASAGSRKSRIVHVVTANLQSTYYMLASVSKQTCNIEGRQARKTRSQIIVLPPLCLGAGNNIQIPHGAS